MSDQNVLDKNLAHQIHAAHTAAYTPYQDKATAHQAAAIVRNMGYEVNVKPHGHVYDINLHPEDLNRIKIWLKSHSKQVMDTALDSFDKFGKFIPKQVEIPLATAVVLVVATSEASANTGDTLTKTGQFLNTATEDIGGKAAREMVAGNYDAAQRDIAEKLIPGADQILRSKEQQAVIDALPKDTATLTSMQSNMKLAPIDRHLAEYQLHYLEAKEHGNLIDGMSAASTLTNLAEMKIKLETQWKAEANTFIAATQYPETDWSQFKKEHPNLAIQADLHTTAQNSGHPQAFVARMDEIIAKNTAQGMPMQPIAQQLSQFSQQQHPANEPVIEQAASR